MSKWIDYKAIDYRNDKLHDKTDEFLDGVIYMAQRIEEAPSIDICFCRECKHRPVKEDADGKNYGFNLIEPTEDDGRCPCLVSDGWYSWMPEDDFYCGYGERKGE